MPELPEIETLRLELGPALVGRPIVSVRAHRAGLRDPFPPEVLRLKNAPIRAVERRSKYLRLRFDTGSLLVHLGMSGQLRLMDAATPRGEHDHLELRLDHQQVLRLRDPRRFGAVLWEPAGTVHPRLAHLGPEPLDRRFTAAYLQSALARRRTPLKAALMDAAVVVGVGNIYATEALFAARLSPLRPAGSMSMDEARRLVTCVRAALRQGIALGGSSMRDYVHADGSLGGFLAQAKVYGRVRQPCPSCGRPLQSDVIAGRTSAWCPHCQH